MRRYGDEWHGICEACVCPRSERKTTWAINTKLDKLILYGRTSACIDLEFKVTWLWNAGEGMHIDITAQVSSFFSITRYAFPPNVVTKFWRVILITLMLLYTYVVCWWIKFVKRSENNTLVRKIRDFIRNYISEAIKRDSITLIGMCVGGCVRRQRRKTYEQPTTSHSTFLSRSSTKHVSHCSCLRL